MIRPDWLALIALAPMMIGPLPSGQNAITASLCGGGTIRIPIDGDDDQPTEQPCSKACHAGACRKRTGKGDILEVE